MSSQRAPSAAGYAKDAARRCRIRSAVAVAVEPLSPELALVCGELRAVAIGRLPELPWRAFAPAPTPVTPTAATTARSLAVDLVVYALWQLFVGAMLGFAGSSPPSALRCSRSAR